MALARDRTAARRSGDPRRVRVSWTQGGEGLPFRSWQDYSNFQFQRGNRWGHLGVIIDAKTGTFSMVSVTERVFKLAFQA